MLAEKLGMSLGEVRALPNSEIVEWGAYLKVKAEQERIHARMEARRRARGSH